MSDAAKIRRKVSDSRQFWKLNVLLFYFEPFQEFFTSLIAHLLKMSTNLSNAKSQIKVTRLKTAGFDLLL